MHLASCSSDQEVDRELSDFLSESTDDDDHSVASWSDIPEDDQFDGSSSDDDIQFCGDSSVQTNESTDQYPLYVYPGSPLLLSESILLILTLAIAHNLNGSNFFGE